MGRKGGKSLESMGVLGAVLAGTKKELPHLFGCEGGKKVTHLLRSIIDNTKATIKKRNKTEAARRSPTPSSPEYSDIVTKNSFSTCSLLNLFPVVFKVSVNLTRKFIRKQVRR